jgi:hypothetical protein
MPFVSAVAAKDYTAANATATHQGRDGASAFVAQPRQRAIGVHGDLPGNSEYIASGPGALQQPVSAVPAARSTTLVQRTAKAGVSDFTSSARLPYPTSSQSVPKRTRVPGSHVCTWEGCSECRCTHRCPSRRCQCLKPLTAFARKERLERHVTSKHLGSKGQTPQHIA